MSDVETLLEDYVDVPAYHMSFKFKFVKQSSGDIYIYILEQPAYHVNQNQSSHATHRCCSNGRQFIQTCSSPTNIAHAKAIAKEWAIRTACYIKMNTFYPKKESSELTDLDWARLKTYKPPKPPHQ